MAPTVDVASGEPPHPPANKARARNSAATVTIRGGSARTTERQYRDRDDLERWPYSAFGEASIFEAVVTAPAQGAATRLRQLFARGFLVLAAVLLPVGVIAGWASATLYDSGTFSRRAGNLLRSPAIRHKIAVELTDQLAASGNEQAVNFRPAMELAIEGAVDTEAFQSIFRTAVATTHHDLLAGGQKGINLSTALPIIATNLQLPNNARPGQNDASALGNDFSDVTHRMAELHVWQIEGWAHSLWLLGFFGGLAAGAAAIALAGDRRRMVAHLGWVLLADGAVIAGAVLAIQWYVGRPIADPELAAAVKSGVGRWTGDLRNIGLWMAGYGVVLAGAAASAGGRTYTPARVARVAGGSTASGPRLEARSGWGLRACWWASCSSATTRSGRR